MYLTIRNLVYLTLLFTIIVSIDNNKLETTDDVKFWATCHLFLHSIVATLNIKKFKEQYTPIVFFLSIMNFITWGVSPFFVNITDFQLGYLNYRALEYAFYGYLIFYLVFTLFGSSSKVSELADKSLPNTHEFTNKKKLSDFKTLKYSFLSLYFLLKIVNIPISGVSELISYYSCGLFLIGFYLGANSTLHNIVLGFLLVSELYSAIAAGLIYPLIYFCFFLFFLIINFYKNSLRNHIVTFSSIIVILIFTTLFSFVKTEYRMLNRTEFTLMQRVELVQQLINSDKIYSSKETIRSNREAKEGPIWRLSYPISAFSLVLEKTPAIVPFWNGESYYPLFVKFIPRFLWPGKPSEQMGQLFGHRYRIIRDNDFYTAMNTPIITEAYMNFSFVGLFGVMIFTAFFISNIYAKDNIKRSGSIFNMPSILNVLKMSYLSTVYLQWESNLSLMFGKIIILIVIDYIFVKLKVS